ncbi:hypothetical protein BX616_006796 [Lobosporangium transversale]|uniref:S-adenosyl-L-methionine-dependent methyltransferase n=1 Tax=Lobosporangium transversale TaxID=64571 RepID=A0A1Y2GVU7_9FUNG|nr:S-adenosyl-L-methionine-dependent methyltransferase [Lobosporangium transversale]KAF9915150.1 hypothetical protein BX616_006796 [Lobosporangium transversale]ORZ23905.1 S-adenosyl-L-methionine-dependent methyltransferase [Lobosporangium transversale]|eukprot:XP_021883719.1 S-adenosyl-L-methionine-dependent methyltransferase [Lobosporangium transversale]
MRSFQAQVKQEDNGTRVWKFVLAQWKTVVKSREQMRRCFKRGEVSVNGVVAEVTRILVTGDLVQIKFDAQAAHESVYGKEKLEICYEDNDLAVIIKPSGKTMVAVGFMLPFSLTPSINAEPGNGEEKMDENKSQLKMDATSTVLLELDKQGTSPTSNEDEWTSPEHDLGQENELSDDDSDEFAAFDVPSNISPTLGQQNCLPCAIHGVEKASNGLVLIAKTAEMRSTLMQMHNSGKITRTFRVICHGGWSRDGAQEIENDMQHPLVYDEGSMIPVNPGFLDAKCIESIRVVKVTPSNEAGSLSTLDVVLRSPFLGVNVRRYLMSAHHPVIGDSGNTKPLKANRNKGLLSCLAKVEFIHPNLNIPITVHLEEPVKFEQLRIREQKACLRRQANDLAELKKGGLELTQTYSRASELPIAYLVGEKDFCDMRFKVSPSTLIPRASTETLVHTAISLAKDRSIKILDVGTGSGCLLLALLKNLPTSIGVGIDISQEALEIAQINCQMHGLTNRALFEIGDLGQLDSTPSLFKSFDLLVCNPPYLDSSKAEKLKKLFDGTEHEPPIALFASSEGYGAYELLAASLFRNLCTPAERRVMADGAHVILEIGSGMGQRVRELFKFLRFVESFRDKQDSERCLVFALPEARPVDYQ